MAGLAILILIAGCAKSEIPSAQLVKRAPASAQESGFLVRGLSSTELLQYLKDNPATKVRELSPQDGLYEIFPSQDAPLPLGRKVIRNSFIPLLHKAIHLDDGNAFLNSCDVQQGSGDFQLQVTPELPAESGERVEVIAKSTGKMDFLFLLAPAAHSLIQNTEQVTNSFSFTPDQTGDFEITVVGKDQNAKCWLQKQNIRVTANPAHDPKQALSAAKKKNFDLKPFWHLQQIGAAEYQAEYQNAMPNALGDDVLIAVIDSGVNYNHPALVENIYKTSDIPNDFTGDQIGYDFVDGDVFPFDDEGHGTHVAALAASNLMGVAPKAKILSVRALQAKGLDLGTITAAIYYAVHSGAKIINMSFGWPAKNDPAQSEVKAAISLAQKKGLVIVAASGNGNGFGLGQNNDEKPMYPASLPNPNIVSVAALNGNQKLAKYSNFGKTTVDIAAPGGSQSTAMIVSAHKETADRTVWFKREGTSQAAPLITGTLALIKSQHPKLTAAQVIQHLYEHSQPDADLEGKVKTGKRLDLRRLLPERHPASILD